MPPVSAPLRKMSAEPNIVTLNVGGQLFQTTPQTLALAGSDSLLASLSAASGGPAGSIPFVDRDPDLFSVLLSLLRTGRLTSKADAFDLRDLVSEAAFYGLDRLLVGSLSDASRFDPFDLQKAAVLPLNGRDAPSAVATTPFGSVHVAHGCKITSFDWSLRRKSTVLTCFPAVDSLLALSPTTAAAGATDFAGLQILDLRGGAVKKALHWSSHPSAAPGAAGATVQGIGVSQDLLFGSFETCRRNASAIVAFDLAGGTLLPAAEIGRREIYGAELDTAIPATKLRWISGRSLLLAAGSHGGPSGLLGNIRLWDVRTPGCAPVWELRESTDCFADVTVSDSLSAIVKVGVNSGELYMADLRKLDAGDPWLCLGNAKKAGNGKKEGSGCRLESYGDQVFCSRGGEVEMWSEVVMGGGWSSGEGPAAERVIRRNLMGRSKDAGGRKITQMGFGGTKMVLARNGQQAVEVWESSSRC
ncbi:hypothetical protein Taro_040831 [Colocasia esculenta]|uniref:BTB domain-containing protein n=1 Tax=Colocasia esculenta TaxID=4460 RepID=A0A843WCU5_COLES|nr:hypothetical protein [Colocasia esculenta]